VGRHCEAGDELTREVLLPNDIRPGDVLAFASTGAYHHGLASTHDAVDRPPLVAVHDGRFHELMRRETTTDLLARDPGARDMPSAAPHPHSMIGYEALLHGE
jgi:diaminopimelate decarboxylase